MSGLIVEQLQALLPPVSYDPLGKYLLAQLGAEAGALEYAVASLEAVQGAIFPATAGDYIADWERVFDLVPASDASQEERVIAVETAMSDLGGQSIPYFIRLAARMGLVVTIDINKRALTNIAAVGDPVPDGDLIYQWLINAPITSYRALAFEALVQRRRPANTEVTVGYGKPIAEGILQSADRLFNTAHYVIPGATNGY